MDELVFRDREVKELDSLQDKKRIDYIDYAKALGIILVILGHCDSFNSFCKVWIYAFHMPLFFLLSGMVLKPRNREFRNSIIKRFKRLIIPYFVWSMIYSSLSFKNLALICYGSHRSLSIAGSLTSLWFFPVLFLAEICGEAFISFIEKHSRYNFIYTLIGGGVFFLVGFLFPITEYGYPLGFNSAFVATGFLLIGKVIFPVIEKIRSFKISKFLVLFLILCLSIAVSLGAYCNIPSYGYVLMAEGYYGNPILFLLFAFAGISVVLCLAILMERIRVTWVKNTFLFIGRNTFVIFLIHKPIISFFEKILDLFSLSNGICLFITTIATLSFCCIVGYVIKLFIPQIIGEKVSDSLAE